MTTQTQETTVTTKRGRKPVFQNKFAVIELLQKVASGEALTSRYLASQLVDMGFLKTSTVKGEGRGRPRIVFEVTGKGRGRLAIAKNWKR